MNKKLRSKIQTCINSKFKQNMPRLPVSINRYYSTVFYKDIGINFLAVIFEIDINNIQIYISKILLLK